jgi:hypothetical protein
LNGISWTLLSPIDGAARSILEILLRVLQDYVSEEAGCIESEIQEILKETASQIKEFKDATKVSATKGGRHDDEKLAASEVDVCFLHLLLC